MLDRISVHGARQHNLRTINVEIPRNTFTVITGLSGSGKSSLAFDTIYAEGPAPLCRDALAVCAAVSRPDGAAGSRFDRRSEPGDLDRAEDHQPQPALDRRHHHRDLRLSAAAVFLDRRSALSRSAASRSRARHRADPASRCWRCSRTSAIMILAPIVRGRKGEYKKELEKLARQGFVRARIDGELRSLDEDDRARQAQESHDRSGGGPAAGEAGHREAAGSLDSRRRRSWRTGW